MKALRISVIVPTRNRRELLLRLLDSLFGQTLPADEYEIIVVSDGSTDGTSEAVALLAEQHPHLRLLERAQGGPGAARNTAARQAKGKCLAFTDDDCVPSPQWLEKLIETFERSEAVAVEGRTI